MEHIQSPAEYIGTKRSVFLAGGITGTDDWQMPLLDSLDGDYVVFNPRRAVYLDTPEVMEQQITWEYNALEQADLIAFWFPTPTLCPITLFELGACCSSNKSILVGAHEDYARRGDLVIQLRLRRPEVILADNPKVLAKQINAYMNSLVGRSRYLG